MKVITGRITSPFGDRTHPVARLKTFHNGVDVSAPIGTPIYSPIDGYVMESYTHASGGETIIIGDGLFLRFGFAHLNKKLVKKGDIIAKGQQIAECGNTGVSTGAHLHFTAKTGGKWTNGQYVGGDFVNPESYLTIQ